MAKQNFETKEGLKKLQDELAFRTGPERNRIKEAIKTAKGFGDLSENSEYDEARESQAKNELRISELEEILKNTTVIDESEATSDKVTLGKTIRVRNENTGKEDTYYMVGATEANPFQKRISNLSPVGVALSGAKVGDTVTSIGPRGEVKYTVLEIVKTEKSN